MEIALWNLWKWVWRTVTAKKLLINWFCSDIVLVQWRSDGRSCCTMIFCVLPQRWSGGKLLLTNQCWSAKVHFSGWKVVVSTRLSCCVWRKSDDNFTPIDPHKWQKRGSVYVKKTAVFHVKQAGKSGQNLLKNLTKKRLQICNNLRFWSKIKLFLCSLY